MKNYNKFKSLFSSKSTQINIDSTSNNKKKHINSPYKKIIEQNRVHIDDPFAINNLKNLIADKLEYNYNPQQHIIIICIGTDRSTGDSLGPLVGTKLSSFPLNDKVTVLGTLESPVHATNLQKHLKNIKKDFINPFIIAIDASLGKRKSVGSMSVNNGPLKPGSGVNKNLPAVGNIHISGLVNVSGYMEYFVLQSTRLSLVIKMSKIISYALIRHLKTYN